MSVSVGGDEATTRRILKTWVVLGQGIASKADHMASALRTELLQAAAAGILMEEAELDRHVSLAEAPQPFNFQLQEQQQHQPSRENILGDAAPGVDA